MAIYGVDYGGGNCSPSINYCNTVFQRVDGLPSIGDATRNHAYITPDNKIYILNADGTGYMQMSTDGGGVTVGLSSNDGSITIVETKDSVTHTFDLKVSDDIINRIIALENRPDKDTIYDDRELKDKINDIISKLDTVGGSNDYDINKNIFNLGSISDLGVTEDNPEYYIFAGAFASGDYGFDTKPSGIKWLPDPNGKLNLTIDWDSFELPLKGSFDELRNTVKQSLSVLGSYTQEFTYTYPVPVSTGDVFWVNTNVPSRNNTIPKTSDSYRSSLLPSGYIDVSFSKDLSPYRIPLTTDYTSSTVMGTIDGVEFLLTYEPRTDAPFRLKITITGNTYHESLMTVRVVWQGQPLRNSDILYSTVTKE